MSSGNPSDPRLLLPEWLRDGDMPVSPNAGTLPAQPVTAAPAPSVARYAVEPEASKPIQPISTVPTTPFSSRLSLDTRLDPGQLVSSSDLPAWLGGLDHAPTRTPRPIQSPSGEKRLVAPSPEPIEEPEPYEGVDAPQDGVIDVQINGWYMLAGAIGLLILLAAALRLYLS